jgi:hypothetical protein
LAVPENSAVPEPSEFGVTFSLARFFFRIKVPALSRVAPLFITSPSEEKTVVPDKTLNVVPLDITLSAIAVEIAIDKSKGIARMAETVSLQLLFRK